MSSASDQLLVQDIRAGAAKADTAYAELVNRYEGRLQAYVRRRLRDHSTVEDVVQEVFIGFLRGICNFDDKRELQTYLFTFINRLLKSVPMKDPHVKDYFESKITFRRLAQRIVKGLKVIVRSAFFFRRDPLGDFAQILERTVAMLASGQYVVCVDSMNSVELQKETDLRHLVFYNQAFRPHLVTNSVFLNKLS